MPIMEGRGYRNKERQPRHHSAALGQGPGSTSRDTHNNVFELFLELKPPTNEDYLIINHTSSPGEHLRPD